MKLQEYIQSSIDNAAVTFNSIFYTTGEYDKELLWNTYLKHAKILNDDLDATDKTYDCSTCKQMLDKIGGLVYLDVATDDTSTVTARSLLWEPANVPEDNVALVTAISEMREVVLSNRRLGKISPWRGELVGCDTEDHRDGNVYTHIYGSLPVISKNPTLPDGKVKQNIVQLHSQRGFFLANGIGELTKICEVELADTVHSSDNKQDIVAIMGAVRAYTKPYQQHYADWMVASNPALVKLCKMYNTPVGVYIRELLTGNDREVALRKLADMTKPEKYMRKQDVSVNSVSEERLLYADRVLTELKLVNSLERAIVCNDDSDIKLINELASKVGGNSDSGPLASLKPKSESLSMVKGEPIDLSDLIDDIPKCVSMEIALVNTYSPLVMMSKQVNMDAKSILRSEEYISTFAFSGCSPAQYLSANTFKVSKCIEVDGKKILIGDNEADRVPDTVTTPLFPITLVHELYDIRKEIEVWANSTTIDIPRNVLLGYRLTEDIHRVMPVIRMVYADSPNIVRERTLVTNVKGI